MIPHQHRWIAIVLFTIAQIANIVLAALDVYDADAAFKIGGALAVAAGLLGIADASVIERRRRDPTKSALKDDVITTTTTRQKRVPHEPIPSDRLVTPGPFRVPGGPREDTPTEPEEPKT